MIILLGMIISILSGLIAFKISKIDEYEIKTKHVYLYILIGFVMFLTSNFSYESLLIAAIVPAILISADIDITYQEISDTMVLFIVIISTGVFMFVRDLNILFAASFILCIFPFFFGSMLSMMGMGDLKIMIGLSFFMASPEKAVLFITVTFLSSLIYGGICKLFKLEYKTIAFIPHIVNGFIVTTIIYGILPV